MKIAVTGKQGQLVQSLVARADAGGHQIVPLGRPEFDLADPAGLADLLDAIAPDTIVSAAAYTAVDKAESEPDLAFAVNAAGPRALAREAARRGIPLVHVSTDYVFPGDKASPYHEDDAVGPLGVYGATKLAGETAVMEEYGANSAVLRTAWVYSPYGANFVKTMLRLADDRDELGVVADQVGNPTSALDIADGVLGVIGNLLRDADPALRGVFHMTARGETSWAGFAEAILAASRDHGGPWASVRHITTADYPTPARRPSNSRLDCSKLEQRHGIRLPAWQESAPAIVARLTGAKH